MHFYFCRLVRIWNSLPPIDLTLSFSATYQTRNKATFLDYFYHALTLHPPVPFMLSVLAVIVVASLLMLNFLLN